MSASHTELAPLARSCTAPRSPPSTTLALLQGPLKPTVGSWEAVKCCLGPIVNNLQDCQCVNEHGGRAGGWIKQGGCSVPTRSLPFAQPGYSPLGYDLHVRHSDVRGI